MTERDADRDESPAQRARGNARKIRLEAAAEYGRGYLAELYTSAVTTTGAESMALGYLVASVDLADRAPRCGLTADEIIAAVCRGMHAAYVEMHGPLPLE